jgi:hypothetical protein
MSSGGAEVFLFLIAGESFVRNLPSAIATACEKQLPNVTSAHAVERSHKKGPTVIVAPSH